VLDYNLLFTLFSFVEGVQSAQGLPWVMFLGDCVEETWVVHVDDLLGFAGLNRQL
jgi:hypothetical protein